MLKRGWLTILLLTVLPISGFVLANTLGQEFFPSADRDQFEVEVWLEPNASIDQTHKKITSIENVIREAGGVTDVNWRIGGSYPTIYYNRIMRRNGDPSYAHAMVYSEDIKAAKNLTRVLPDVLGVKFPEALIVVAPFAQGQPVDSPVGFEISGPDLEMLKYYGNELRRIMQSVPGIQHTRSTISGGLAKVSFNGDSEIANVAGLSLNELGRQLQASLDGQIGGSLLQDLEELPVRVRLENSQRENIEALNSLQFRSSVNAEMIPASSLGEARLTPVSSSISRINGQRYNEILGYISSDSLAIDVTNAIEAKLQEEVFTLPVGYQLKVAGDSEQQSMAFADLFTYLPILLMLMITTIVLAFQNARLAGLIGIVAVFSVGLGFLSLWFGGYARGFNAILGSVGLVGVAINGSIVVLAAIRSDQQASNGDLEAIVNTTIAATRHIAATTLTTIGGFLPLLLSGGDFWPPLAIVIAGGVGFSITLSLVFVPTVYYVMHRSRQASAGFSHGLQTSS